MSPSIATEAERILRNGRPVSPPKQAPELLHYVFADAGNGDRLLALHGDDLRYCYPMRLWLVWDGKRWAADDGGLAAAKAKDTAVEFLRQALSFDNSAALKFAKSSLDQRRISAALWCAQCDRPISPAELDTRADLLNFTNGTVNLRTGELHSHRREDYITKLVNHDYQPGAECPQILAFLDRIMGGGADAGENDIERAGRRISWLQRAFGYSVTGSTSEKAVFRNRQSNHTLDRASGLGYRFRAAQAAGVSSGSLRILVSARPGRTAAR